MSGPNFVYLVVFIAALVMFVGLYNRSVRKKYDTRPNPEFYRRRVAERERNSPPDPEPVPGNEPGSGASKFLTDEQSSGLDVAICQADLLGFEVVPETRLAGATFRVLTLPEEGPPPGDSRVQILFKPVGRVSASLRDGSWDDPDAEVVPFQIEELLTVVQSFEGAPIYGSEFIDVEEKRFEKWSDRLSLDWTSGQDGRSHSISVFQDPGPRVLELRVWFDYLRIFDPEFNEISIDVFIAGGQRWWNAFYKGDERTRGHGLHFIKSSPQ